MPSAGWSSLAPSLSGVARSTGSRTTFRSSPGSSLRTPDRRAARRFDVNSATVARLDPIFERLLREGTELLFETGAPAIMRTHAGDVPVLRQQLAAQPIAGVFAEPGPTGMASTFP